MAQPAGQTPVIRDPFTVWLRTLQAGAVIGALTYALLAVWTYARLSSRVQLYPPRRFLDNMYPFVQLVLVAFNWMCVWLLSTRWPLYDPLHERRIPALLRRRLADFLRLIASGLFVLWSLRVWGLIGPTRRLTVNYPWFVLAATGGDLTCFLLLWYQLYSLALRIKLRGLAWRAALVLGVVGASRIILNLVFVVADEWGSPVQLTDGQANLRAAIMVIMAVMPALAMGRYIWGFQQAIRKMPRNGPRP